MKNKYLTLALGLVVVAQVNGQDLAQAKPLPEDTNTTIDFLNMSLEQMMNVKIVSASRKEEKNFDAPTTSYVISYQEIEAAGATSIPDALRLCPAILVREIANGTYDVSIRGGIDGFPSQNYSTANYAILAMIDNRPVFSSFQGGTFWQNLPISLADIERIEVVYGPSSALYGPNAVSGVINIITKRPKDNKELSANAQVTGGTHMLLGTALVGYRFNDKFAFDVYGNFEQRKRFEELYYRSAKERYESVLDSAVSAAFRANKNDRIPNPDLSLQKIGGGANLYFDLSNDVKFVASGGANQSSGFQSLSSGLPLAVYTNNAVNGYLHGKIKKFGAQFSYLGGTQGLGGNYEQAKYNYSNIDGYVDYNFELLSKKLSIRPAIAYQSFFIDDRPYTIDKGKTGQFNGTGNINNVSGSVKFDYTPVSKLRLIAALRYDRFNSPAKGFLSYQFIANYKISEKHILRALTSKSYNGSFVVPTLLNTENITPSTTPAPSRILQINGNKNLELPNNTMYEIGYRGAINKYLSVDISVYRQYFNNFTAILYNTSVFDPIKNTVTLPFKYDNLNLNLIQNGVTLAVQSSFLDGAIQFKPHITLQETKAYEYSPYYNAKGAYDRPATPFSPAYTLNGHRDSTSTIVSPYTPTIWGGANLIVTPFKKLTIDVSGYYFSSHKSSLNAETSFTNGQYKAQKGGIIESTFLLNACVNYKFYKHSTAFVNARNILNQKGQDTFGADKMGFLINLGLRFNY